MNGFNSMWYLYNSHPVNADININIHLTMSFKSTYDIDTNTNGIDLIQVFNTYYDGIDINTKRFKFTPY